MTAAISFLFSAKCFSDKIDIIERQRNREIGKCLRNARAVGPPMSERAAPGLDQQRIGVTVIAAVELDDLVAPGESARQPKARHRRFGAAVDHPNFFDRRHPIGRSVPPVRLRADLEFQNSVRARRRRAPHRRPLSARDQESPGPSCRRNRCIRFHRHPRSRAPSARSTKNGSPPTLRNARTGEFTPPGMRFCAACKKFRRTASHAPKIIIKSLNR